MGFGYNIEPKVGLWYYKHFNRRIKFNLLVAAWTESRCFSFFSRAYFLTIFVHFEDHRETNGLIIIVFDCDYRHDLLGEVLSSLSRPRGPTRRNLQFFYIILALHALFLFTVTEKWESEFVAKWVLDSWSQCCESSGLALKKLRLARKNFSPKRPGLRKSENKTAQSGHSILLHF